MKFFKSFFVLMLALCMMVSLCACGGEGDASAETTNNDVAETTNNEVEETTAATDDKITYKVTVVDEENKPVVGAMVQLCLDAQDVLGLNFNIARLTLRAAQGLMNHNFTVGHGVTLTPCAAGKKECAHGRSQANAGGGYVAANEVHGVVNCHTCRNRTARTVDV